MKFLALILLAGMASAYHPYLTKPSVEIDSEEHGVLPGRKSTSCKCGWANRVTSRIVGGQETGVNQFPWVVGLLFRNSWRTFCGGSIITEYHVLTAAHCTEGFSANRLAVVVGDHNLQTMAETDVTQYINVRHIIDHERYNITGAVQNDISLLTLENKIRFSQKVGPACLPNSRNAFNLVEKYIKVLGWGRLQTNGQSSVVLRHTNLRVIPLQICRSTFGSGIDTATPTQFCTFSKNRDSCQGDSGGPLVFLDPDTNRYTLVGLVSFGGKCADITPGVNTEVAAYIDWIQRNIQRSNPDGRTCAKI